MADTGVKSVLVVDDEPVFLASLLDGLSAYGEEFTVLSARDGAEALDILASRSVDLVATDLRMPGVDGFALLAALRDRFPATEAIVMTAIGSPAVEARLRPLAPLAVLDKPLDLDQLVEAIRRALGSTPGAGTPGASGGRFRARLARLRRLVRNAAGWLEQMRRGLPRVHQHAVLRGAHRRP